MNGGGRTNTGTVILFYTMTSQNQTVKNKNGCGQYGKPASREPFEERVHIAAENFIKKSIRALQTSIAVSAAGMTHTWSADASGMT